MKKPDRKKWPNLAAAWDEYGHSVKFEELIDIKSATTHHYVVVAWMEGKLVNYADLGGGSPWEMLNDGHEPITPQQWKTARIVPHCDELEIKE